SYANAAAYANHTKKERQWAGWKLAFIITAYGTRTNGVSPQATDFDPQIKAYIDNACQMTITTLLRRMEEMMNCQAKTQRLWNKQIEKVLDEHFSKLEQVSLTANEASTNNRRMNEETQNEQATPVTICSQPVMRDELPQANTVNIRQ
ncbi:37405_t:CDS:2, partial [Gigaspora margarita]